MTINFKLIKKYFDEKIKNNYSEDSDSAYSCNYVNKYTKATTLWENSAPNLSFSSQTIELSSDDYDYLECFYYNYAISGFQQVQSVKVPKGYSFNLATTIYAESNMHYGSRPVTRNSDTSFTFGTNKGVATFNSSGVLTDDSWAVPIKIVGYKSA